MFGIAITELAVLLSAHLLDFRQQHVGSDEPLSVLVRLDEVHEQPLQLSTFHLVLHG